MRVRESKKEKRYSNICISMEGTLGGDRTGVFSGFGFGCRVSGGVRDEGQKKGRRKRAQPGLACLRAVGLTASPVFVAGVHLAVLGCASKSQTGRQSKAGTRSFDV